MVNWKEIVAIVGAHMIEFAWEISIEIRIQNILEAMVISGSRIREKETATLTMK